MIDEIWGLVKQYGETQVTGISDRINAICTFVLEKQLLTCDEIEKTIEPNIDNKTIKELFSETE
jgi:hypothetical protein